MKKKILIGLGIVVGILLAIYLGLAIYFNSHYFWHTTINSVKYGGKTSEYAVSRNTELSKDYLLTVTDRNDNKFKLTGSDFSYEYTSTGEEKNILKGQNSFTWPACIFKSYDYELEASSVCDDSALESAIDSLEIFSDDYITQPENAYISVTDGDYEVVSENPGTVPIRDTIINEIKQAVVLGQNTVTLSDDCYEKPEITAETQSLKDAVSKIENYCNSTISYDIDGADEGLTKADILGMLVVGDDFSVSIDDEKLTKYVQSLASKYNTYGDVRAFTTSSGDVVNIGGGDYGWVIDKKSEKAQLLSDLESGEAVNREPVYEQTALQSGTDDIGNTYIEIDYTKQHLWYYKDGVLQTETDIVSGNLSKQNGSVDGVYKIVYKQRNATLVGEGYSSPVNFFMPFAYNIGIHDAGWRSSFGGEIYKTSGSHGCINIPPEIAETLFNTVETGTPVVAYYREAVTLTNNAAKMSNAYSYVAQE